MEYINAQLQTGKRTSVPVKIPIDSEIQKLAMKMHESRSPRLETHLGWKVFYNPSELLQITLTPVNPFTGIKGESTHKPSNRAAYFVFGYNSDWNVTLTWINGDDKPPLWSRKEDKIIKE